MLEHSTALMVWIQTPTITYQLSTRVAPTHILSTIKIKIPIPQYILIPNPSNLTNPLTPGQLLHPPDQKVIHYFVFFLFWRWWVFSCNSSQILFETAPWIPSPMKYCEAIVKPFILMSSFILVVEGDTCCGTSSKRVLWFLDSQSVILPRFTLFWWCCILHCSIFFLKSASIL